MFFLYGNVLFIISFFIIIYYYYLIIFVGYPRVSIVIFLYNFFYIIFSFSVFCLFYCYTQSDFTLLMVEHNSNYTMPLLYKVCCLWGSHEGSIFFWIWVLTLYGFLFLILNSGIAAYLIIQIFVVYFFFLFFFFCYTLFTSNPFLLSSVFSSEGLELNPILQDPGLIIHPPVLYLGYLGYSIVFTIAFVLLLNLDFSKKWWHLLRFYNYIAWLFLTLGIFLGSWWAYHELGWGGWWFWDPVENFSLFPWLCSTILMHSLLAALRCGKFYLWNLFICLFTFFLSIFGTFFIRSGILTSVHSFSVDPSRGYFIILFLIVLVICSFYFFIRYLFIQYNYVQGIRLYGRVLSIVVNNVLFIFYLFFLLLGTLLPLIYTYIFNTTISVGVIFFNTITIVFVLPLLFWLFYTVFCTWQKNNILGLFFSLFIICCLCLFVNLVFFYKIEFFMCCHSILGTFLLFFAITVLLSYICVFLNSYKHFSFTLGHFGFCFLVFSIVFSVYGEEEISYIINVGEQFRLGDYIYILRSLNVLENVNYNSFFYDIIVFSDVIDNVVNISFPEQRFYFDRGMHVTKTVVISNIFKDLYIIPVGGNVFSGWAIHVFEKPFIAGIWCSTIFFVGVAILGMFNAFYEFKKIK